VFLSQAFRVNLELLNTKKLGPERLFFHPLFPAPEQTRPHLKGSDVGFEKL